MTLSAASAATCAGSERRYGGRATPDSVTIAVTSAGGRDVERGIERRGTRRRDPLRPPTCVTSSGSRSSIAIAAPSARREVDRRRGRGDVERDPVMAREHRERVRPDLVRDVAVGRDAIGADDHEIDRRPRAISAAGRAVGDRAWRRCRAARAPTSSGARPAAAGAVSSTHTRGVLPGFERGADDAERGAVAHARERARVAVREHRARRPGTSAAPCAPMRRLRATSSAAICSAAVERGRRRHRARTRREPRSTPHARLTAVGRVRAMPRRGRARTSACVRSVRAASATPYAPAAPSAGAPRTASVGIASTSCVDGRGSRGTAAAPGSARWSSRRTGRAATRSSAGSVRREHRRGPFGQQRETELRVRAISSERSRAVHDRRPRSRPRRRA